MAALAAPLVENDIQTALFGVVGIGAVSALAISDKKGFAFSLIPVSEAMAIFTNTFVKYYREFPEVKSFLRSFFPSNFSKSKYISIGVRRGTELMAVDVRRYSDGNRNTFDKATLKTFQPPFYHEYLDISAHHLYDNMIEMLANGSMDVAANLAREMALDFVELRKKIERRHEYMCAQVLLTGVVTMTNGDDVDFKRKAASIVAYSAPIDFSVGTVDPSAVIKAGCEFIRTNGKTDAAMFDLILGELAMSALINNTIIKDRNDIRNYALDQINAPFMNTNGAAFHGELTCGSYKVRLWTYPQTYETTPGTSVNYIDSKKIILLPNEPIGSSEFALVPQLPRDGRLPQTGPYLIQEEIEYIQAYHRMHIKSTVLPIPVAIDKIWTATVLS